MRSGSRASTGRPLLGSAAGWSRDLAIVGAATSFLAGFGIEGHVRAGMLVGAGVGVAVGALFGVAFRQLLARWLRLPILAWIPISVALGALFGFATGLTTELLTRDTSPLLFLALFGAFAGALQLSWFWLPYAVRAGRGKSTWPLVVAAVVIAGVIGRPALRLMFAILAVHID